jgi:DNA topoisomerase 2-associated protein PAT1
MLRFSLPGSQPRNCTHTGLGKVVLTNIRTPKMLMDVGGGGSSKAAGTDGSSSKVARPLEQEPMLAARIMVEDCMLLLCDVEDLDRTFAATLATGAAMAAGAPLPAAAPAPLSPDQAAALLQRRAALLGGIAASFRLPDAPVATAGGVGSDGVFLRILALPKGRSLVGKTLRLMFSPPPALSKPGDSRGGGAAGSSSSSQALGLDVIWALLRNCRAAFGPALSASAGEAERRMTHATITLSAAASEMMKRLAAPQDAVACLAACIAGLGPAAGGDGGSGDGPANGDASTPSSQLLPLFPAGRVEPGASPEWLSTILGALLLRASELGLGSFAAEAAAAPQRSLGDGATAAGDDDDGAAGLPAGSAVPPAVAAEWAALIARLTHTLQLHLWQLVQAARGQGAEVAAAAGGGADVLAACASKLACVPLMRGLMAHCEAEQGDQIKAYLSEIGGR